MLNEIKHGVVQEIRMERAPANALNEELVTAVRAAHAGACDQGAKAIVLSGLPGMFSGGIDVPELLETDRAGVRSFWNALLELALALASSPVPVVAAITGHSPAGGAVLAVHCDYRIAARGEFKIGFNEVQVGLPVPRTILLALERLVGCHVAETLAMQGQLISPEEALSNGLVDELAEPDGVVARALQWAEMMTGLPPVAMNQTRLSAKSRFIDELKQAGDATAVTEYWFSDETQAAMNKLAENLRK